MNSRIAEFTNSLHFEATRKILDDSHFFSVFRSVYPTVQDFSIRVQNLTHDHIVYNVSWISPPPIPGMSPVFEFTVCGSADKCKLYLTNTTSRVVALQYAHQYTVIVGITYAIQGGVLTRNVTAQIVTPPTGKCLFYFCLFIDLI